MSWWALVQHTPKSGLLPPVRVHFPITLLEPSQVSRASGSQCLKQPPKRKLKTPNKANSSSMPTYVDDIQRSKETPQDSLFEDIMNFPNQSYACISLSFRDVQMSMYTVINCKLLNQSIMNTLEKNFRFFLCSHYLKTAMMMKCHELRKSSTTWKSHRSRIHISSCWGNDVITNTCATLARLVQPSLHSLSSSCDSLPQ